MKMMQGAFFLACSNISRTRLAPTPTNISTKSEPEMVKNGTLASPATERASSVLPVPGGPTSSTPRGIRPPRRWNLPGSRRNSTISSRSCLASSTPATSSNVTLPVDSVSSLARDLPKPIAPPLPPPCICRMKKNHTPIMTMKGNQEDSRIDQNGLDSGACAVMETSLFSSLVMTSAPSGSTVSNRVPSESVPDTTLLVITTFCTRPASMSVTNWL